MINNDAPRAPRLENLQFWRAWLERHRGDSSPPEVWVDVIDKLLAEVEALRAELTKKEKHD